MASDKAEVELEEHFRLATAHVQAVAAELEQALLLRLYGLFKQATVGACDAPQPSWFNPMAKRKWEAWHALGAMSGAEAKRGYVRLLHEALPGWLEEARELPSGWAAVSCPLAEPEERLADADKTLLDWAKEGLVGRVRQLAAEGHKLDQWDELGMTALHWAADRGNCDVVECLLQLGAQVDFRDADGQTALHYAASCGHADVVRLLLAAGADPEAQDAEGERPRDVAAGPDVGRLLAVPL